MHSHFKRKLISSSNSIPVYIRRRELSDFQTWTGSLDINNEFVHLPYVMR